MRAHLNVVQCLNDFNIPLYLSHTVESVHGDGRLKSITLIEVDDKLQKIEGSEQEIKCDLLLLSVGLIPENSLIEELGVKLDPRTKGAIVDDTYMTSIDGIFACGNALHVHDLVDYVSQEARKAGKSAAEYVLKNKCSIDERIELLKRGKIALQKIHSHTSSDVLYTIKEPQFLQIPWATAIIIPALK